MWYQSSDILKPTSASSSKWGRIWTAEAPLPIIPIFFPLDICELPVLFEGYDLKIGFSSLTTLTLFTKSTFLKNQNANCKICFNCHKILPKTTELISQNFWTTTVATISLLQIPPQTAKIIWMDTYLSKMVWNIITVPSFPFINLHTVDRITFLIIAEDKIPNSRILRIFNSINSHSIKIHF